MLLDSISKSPYTSRGTPTIRGVESTPDPDTFEKCPLQQLTYGVVSEGVFAEILRKFCGKFAETTFYCARKGCGNSAESLRKFRRNLRKIFCNDPFPNDPISELLTSDTKLLLTKNYSEIIIFEKLRISRVIPFRMSFFPGHVESTKSLKNYEK